MTSFGGGSGRAHAEIKSRFTEHPLWHHLSAKWTDRRAEAIIQLAEAVGQHSYFLSYSHQDIEFCDFVHLSFFENTRVVLRDRNQLRAGKPVQSKLYEAIGRAETFVLSWGTTSAQSEWCQKELEVGLRLHERGLPPHRIVLFLRDDTPIPPELSEYLQLNAKNRDQADSAVRRLIYEETAEG